MIDEVGVGGLALLLPARVESATRLAGSPNGGGLKSRAWTRLNTAVVIPIPRLTEATAARVNPGLRRSARALCRKA